MNQATSAVLSKPRRREARASNRDIARLLHQQYEALFGNEKRAAYLVNAVIQGIVDVLVAKGRIHLRGFGTLRITEGAKDPVNRHGKARLKFTRVRVSVTASSVLKDQLNPENPKSTRRAEPQEMTANREVARLLRRRFDDVFGNERTAAYLVDAFVKGAIELLISRGFLTLRGLGSFRISEGAKNPKKRPGVTVTRTTRRRVTVITSWRLMDQLNPENPKQKRA